MSLNIKLIKFDIGQKVYLVADSDIVGFVTGILFRQNNNISYIVMWGDREETYHCDFELTIEKLYNIPSETNGDD